MSLQVWLPLNGNVNNQGLSGHNMSGHPAAWSAGKVTNYCATYNGNVGYMTHNDTTDFNYTDNFSYCVWLKHNYTGSTAQYAFTVGRADTGGYGYGIQILSASQIALAFGSAFIAIPCPANEWHHVALTVSGTVIKVYLDGALYTTKTVGILPTYSDGAGLGLGCFHYISGNIYPYYGSLNDFRIYDHCLSAKEVSEIAKGLCLHYKLSNQYETGMRNIYSGDYAEGSTGSYDSRYTKTKLTDERGYNYKLYYTGTGVSTWPAFRFPNFSFTAGKKYYYSCKVRCHSANIAIRLRAARSDNDWVTNSANILHFKDSEWHEYYVYQTINETYDRSGSTITCNPCLEFYSDDLPTEGTVYYADFDIKDVQVIESDEYVPFTINEFISEVSDCSGFGNDGTKSGNISWSSDTARYSGSYNFSTTKSHIKIPRPLSELNSTSSLTVSMWVKPQSGCGGYATILSNYNSLGADGFWIAINTEGCGVWFFNGNYAKGYNDLLPINEWSHIAATFSAGTVTWYVNGVKCSSHNVSSRHVGFTEYIAVGNSYTGSNWNTNFVGQISDLRIYTTALSAEDIEALYSAPISLSKNGVLFASEFQEV